MFFSKLGLVLAGLYFLFVVYVFWYANKHSSNFGGLVILIVPMPWNRIYSLFFSMPNGLTKSLLYSGIILNLISLYVIGFFGEKLFSFFSQTVNS